MLNVGHIRFKEHSTIRGKLRLIPCLGRCAVVGELFYRISPYFLLC